MSSLLHEIEEKSTVITNLKEEIAMTQWRIGPFEVDPMARKYYTGLTDTKQFRAFCNMVLVSRTPVCRKFNPEDEIFILLCKLRTGCTHYDLAQRFVVDRSTISRILAYWITRVYKSLKIINLWPEQSVIDKTMPISFIRSFPQCRVIIDCTEIEIQQPSNPTAQQMWSHYKNTNTLKALVGITPNGAISFVSDLYGGSTSDKYLLQNCGVLQQLEENDLVLADRGFSGSFTVDGKTITVVTPPFMDGRAQLTHREVLQTRNVAHNRIHVERAIGRIKTFKYFAKPIDIKLLYEAEEVFYICAFLCNAGEPLMS
ncbi:uncharacterized protein LOC135389197 [Ornithodoros turicata]|uniref:uncharacterized protein LOC135389197 n=1 Tax=Ornithodoros turicata TaxID=34597 RepID=UPI0031395F40